MRIDNTRDVTSGADSDSQAIYIDRTIPQFSRTLRDAAGRPANLWKYLSVHEITEARAMAAGLPYEKAHLLATSQERQAVERDGVSWKLYEAEINGHLSHIEGKKPKNPPPPDQHVAPHRAVRRGGQR